jgi:hypothetical protein
LTATGSLVINHEHGHPKKQLWDLSEMCQCLLLGNSPRGTCLCTPSPPHTREDDTQGDVPVWNLQYSKIHAVFLRASLGKHPRLVLAPCAHSLIATQHHGFQTSPWRFGIDLTDLKSSAGKELGVLCSAERTPSDFNCGVLLIPSTYWHSRELCFGNT